MDDIDLHVFQQYAGKVPYEELLRVCEILRVEVERLRNIEALRDILQGEVDDLHVELNAKRVEVADLKSAIEGMVTDMSLMEETIRELSGREPGGDDFGP